VIGLIAEITGATVGFLLFGGLVAGIANKIAGIGFDSPESRAIKTTIIAWVVIGAVAIFGYSNGAFAWWAPLFYLPGAIILWRFNLARYRRKAEIKGTFG